MTMIQGMAGGANGGSDPMTVTEGTTRHLEHHESRHIIVENSQSTCQAQITFNFK